jgi:DNA-binding winged helix-turn-helix (wHTH) protein/tetratricopeptide (TPR) repeat protein/TolB-like protein
METIQIDTVVKPARVTRFGVFEVDRHLAELRRHGVRVRLQQQPLQILLILLDHAGELVGRDQLRQQLWPDDTFVDFDHNLSKAMNKLRRALGDSADNPRFIETLHRKGYRFIASMSVPERDPPPTVVDGAAVSPVATATGADERTAPGVPRPALLWNRIGVVFIMLICMGTLGYFYLHSARRGGSMSTVKPRRSITVLGFKNLSGSVGDAWLSTALSDWLSTDLSAGDQLRTLSSEDVARMEKELSLTSADSLQASGLGKDELGRIGRNLSTDYVVTGAYAVIGKDSDGQVRLDLRLQDTRTGETVTAVSETGTASNLFSLVSGAGEHLRSKLGVVGVTREEANEVSQTLPENHDAARLYSEGLEKLHIFDALSARDLLEKSIAIEPGYSLSHASLAIAWEELGYDSKAEMEANTALKLSFKLAKPERLLVKGHYDEMSKNWDSAINVYRALVEFFPDSLDYGLALAHAQVGGGKGIDALATVDTLRRLPAPLSEDPRLDLAEDCAAESLGDFKRDLSAATRASQKARAIGASLLLAQALADEGWAFDNLGQPDAAVAAAEESKQLFAAAGDQRGVGLETNAMGITLYNKGDAADAKAKFEESRAINEKLGSEMSVAGVLDDLGDVLMALGEPNESRRSYEESLKTYRELRHEDGVALAKNGLATVLLATGDHLEAKKNFEESLEICLRLGDKSKASFDLVGLGEVLRAEGDFNAAQKYQSQALSAFQALGEQSGVAQAELSTAELMIDEGNTGPAVREAREAAAEFAREKESDKQAMADAILARALLAEGKIGEAQNAIGEANSALSRCDRREAALLVSINLARVDAASDNLVAKKRARNTLERALSQSRQIGFVSYEFEARLALVQLEMRSGSSPAARAHLYALEKEADAKGFGRIAHQAAATDAKVKLI